MTIQDLGAIGEFVASIAVLVTLLFLVVQMRQNTVVLKRTSVRQAASEHANALRNASLDGEIAEIVMRGWADLEALILSSVTVLTSQFTSGYLQRSRLLRTTQAGSFQRNR